MTLFLRVMVEFYLLQIYITNSKRRRQMQTKILHSGLYTGDKNIREHFHHGTELIYCLAGHCVNRSPSGMIEAYSGEVVVIPPEMPHRQIDFGNVETLYVVFESVSEPFFQSFKLLNTTENSFIAVWFRQIYDLYTKHCIEECNILIELLVLHLKKCSEEFEHSGQKPPSLLVKAMKYSSQNFTCGISVRDIAGFCQCSEGCLNDLFKKYCGKSTLSYISGLRMSLARRLLLHTPMSVKEISDACGYNRSNYFCRIFRKEHRCTPLEFRSRQGDLDYTTAN